MSARRLAPVMVIALALSLAGCTTRVVLVEGVDGGRADAGSFETRDAIAQGIDHGCALFASTLYCTGANAAGQLGLRDRMDRTSLTLVDDMPRLLELSAGYQSSAVLTVDGDVLTFGSNTRGQLGRGDVPGGPVLSRVAVPGLVAHVTQRFDHGCAILRNGELWCWGSNSEGELGQGDAPDSADRSEPTRVASGTAFSDVSAGQGHTCAIAIGGELWCWGRNSDGELGVGAAMGPQLRTPTEIPGSRWRSVVAGQSHTCGIRTEGDLYCWGSDGDADGHAGPVGLATSATHHEPALVDDAGDWSQISTDTFHGCGVRSDGSLWCWGRNAEGQLGLGDMTTVVQTPARVGTDSDWSSVAVGRFSTCAQKRDGRVLCAGANRTGELGVGDLDRRATLTEALGPS